MTTAVYTSSGKPNTQVTVLGTCVLSPTQHLRDAPYLRIAVASNTKFSSIVSLLAALGRNGVFRLAFQAASSQCVGCRAQASSAVTDHSSMYLLGLTGKSPTARRCPAAAGARSIALYAPLAALRSMVDNTVDDTDYNGKLSRVEKRKNFWRTHKSLHKPRHQLRAQGAWSHLAHVCNKYIHA